MLDNQGNGQPYIVLSLPKLDEHDMVTGPWPTVIFTPECTDYNSVLPVVYKALLL